MKSFICSVFLVCAIVAVLACDPDSNNQPSCSSSNLNVPVRNFWDPTTYWLCNAEGAAAELVRCEDSYLFDSALGECVLWIKWAWTNPCPAN